MPALGANVAGPVGPSQRVYMLTPSDTDLAVAIRSLYVTNAGNVKLTYLNGVTETLTVPAGYTIGPAMIGRVWQTGTTATTFIASE